MKGLIAITVFSMLFSMSGIERIAKDENLVTDVEAISIDGEWYVALITEPIFTLSERVELCERIREKIYTDLGLKSNVIIDVGLFFDIKYTKTLTDIEQISKHKQQIQKFFMRRNNEYQRDYKSQKKWSDII